MSFSSFRDLLRNLHIGGADAALGECLQFGSHRKKSTPVILGVDFGTSCTKAVIRVPYVQGGRALAVPLNDKGSDPYLLPTRNPSQLPPISQSVPVDNPKVRLLVEPKNQDARELVTAYLSHVMRRSRAWLLHTQRSSLGDFRLEWSTNIGVPSAGYVNDPIREGFLTCARAAWKLSMQPGLPSLDQVRAALGNGGSFPDVDALPEVLAAAEGYRRSVHASSGMHVMVDVGASTLDVCGFAVRDPNSATPYGLFTTAVEQLGVAVLHDARLEALNGHQDPGPAARVDPRDPVQRVPDELQGYVSQGGGIPPQLAAADARFHDDCQLAVRRVVCGMYVKNPIDHQWKDGIPVFLTGGGGQMRFYREVLDGIAVDWTNWKWSKLTVNGLVVPSDLSPKHLTVDVMSRLVVAYGLSFPRVNFGNIINPATLPNIPPPPPRRIDDLFFG